MLPNCAEMSNFSDMFFQDADHNVRKRSSRVPKRCWRSYFMFNCGALVVQQCGVVTQKEWWTFGCAIEDFSTSEFPSYQGKYSIFCKLHKYTEHKFYCIKHKTFNNIAYQTTQQCSGNCGTRSGKFWSFICFLTLLSGYF